MCANYAAQGGAGDAALYSALFDGRIGTVLSVAQNKERRAQLDQALTWPVRLPPAMPMPPLSCWLGMKDKAAAAALLTDLLKGRCGPAQCPQRTGAGDAARRTPGCRQPARWSGWRHRSAKAVLSVLAIKLAAAE